MVEYDPLRAIVHPDTEHERTQALQSLYVSLHGRPSSDGVNASVIPEELLDFLRSYATDDFRQAAWIGLILLHREPETAGAGLYCRLLLGLTLHHEGDLRRFVVEQMPSGLTPLGLYEQAVALTTTQGDPHSADFHYAYKVLSVIAPSTLADRWQAYLPG